MIDIGLSNVESVNSIRLADWIKQSTE
jgi:hypothetical protein